MSDSDKDIQSADEFIYSWLSGRKALVDLGLMIRPDIPEDRDPLMLGFERTGGPMNRIKDCPVYAFQIWATTRAEAFRIAEVFILELHLIRRHPAVREVDVSTAYNWPDPNTKIPRVQVVASFILRPRYYNS